MEKNQRFPSSSLFFLLFPGSKRSRSKSPNNFVVSLSISVSVTFDLSHGSAHFTPPPQTVVLSLRPFTAQRKFQPSLSTSLERELPSLDHSSDIFIIVHHFPTYVTLTSLLSSSPNLSLLYHPSLKHSATSNIQYSIRTLRLHGYLEDDLDLEDDSRGHSHCPLCTSHTQSVLSIQYSV